MTAPDNEAAAIQSRSTIYDPIPPGEFLRILTLHPGSVNDDIRCELKVKSCKRAKDNYAAISYVWGDSSDTIELSCNGEAVQVTRNLADALRQFRHPRTVRRLWADALCINQKDEQEKNHQVRMMGAIYRDAKEVLVWLGQDSGFAKDCFRMIERTNEYLGEQYEKFQGLFDMPRLQEPHPIPLDHETWERVETLIGLPWFQRAWTVQECALAKRCRAYWGSASIDIADIYEISWWCARYNDLVARLQSCGIDRCGNLNSRFQSVHCHYGTGARWQLSRPGIAEDVFRYKVSTLTHILHVGRRFKATDSRDHVFAFHDCPYAKDETGMPLFKVDYSVPVEDVWYQIACDLLHSPSEGPWLLSAVKHRSQLILLTPNRPTWVPYWDLGHPFRMLADPANYYRAGGSRSTFSATPQIDRTLEVPGSLVDSIVWWSDPLWENNFRLKNQRDPGMWQTNEREPAVDKFWREISAAAERLHLPFTPSRTSFMLTLLAADRKHSAEVAWLRDVFEDYCTLVRSEYPNPPAPNRNPPELSDADIAEARNMMTDLDMFAQEKALFLTRGGRLGTASWNLVEVGDVCCVFAGAPVPFVLRPSSGGRFKLVCECFIQGIMRGQVWGLNVVEPITLE